MKRSHLYLFALVALLGAGAVIALPATVQAEDDVDSGLAKLGRALAGTEGKLAAAITAAETKAKGTAFGAKAEVEKGRLVYEVFVYVAGDEAKVLEVEIDAATGEVLEVEDADDEDDDDEDDDDDEETGDDD